MKNFIVALVLVLCGGFQVFGQEASADPVTEEELTQYATVEHMTSEFVKMKTDELRNMILNNEVIDGGARYNEIKASWGDDAKLAEIEISEEEKEAYQTILDFQGSLQQSVVDYKTNLITDSDVISVSVYNKVLGAMKADPSVKETIDSLQTAMKEETSEDPAEGEGGN